MMLGVGFAVLATLGLAFGTAPRWLVPLIAARSRKCLYAVRTAERIMALTFDDGPDPSHTPAILDVLHAHDARATFFLIRLASRATKRSSPRSLNAGTRSAIT